MLIVLSMLTLFMMLGVTYLIAATRARNAARAYAKLTFGGDDAFIPAHTILDAVLLRVLAGGTNSPPTAPAGVTEPLNFESLLGDKYGEPNSPLKGTLDAVTISSGVITTAVTLDSPVRPAALNGQIITFIEPGRRASSHRIIRASRTGDSNQSAISVELVLDRPIGLSEQSQPTEGCRFIVNGREFAGNSSEINESWDGFDNANPFLARLTPSASVSSSTVHRISYFPTLFDSSLSSAISGATDGLPHGADNDGDGILDGMFLNWGLPPVTDAYGNLVSLEAAVLVVDLDGRFNVNAHGGWSALMYPATHNGWKDLSFPGVDLADVPLGNGYGPSEISANAGKTDEPKSPSTSEKRLFDGDDDSVGAANPNPRTKENPKASLLAGAAEFQQSATDTLRMRGTRPNASRFAPGTSTFRLPSLQGKYGNEPISGWAALTGTATLSSGNFQASRPGIPRHNDAFSKIQDQRSTVSGTSYGFPPTWWDGTKQYNWAPAEIAAPPPRGVFNSPPDLHGRMKTLTITGTGGALAPQLIFVQPEWGTGTIAQDDPYELLLDTRRGIGGWVTTGTSVRHNPFTLGELESILRPYDIDTNRTPARLTALLGSFAESSRLALTTESWDTTAIVGGDAAEGAASRIQEWLNKVPADETLYGESPLAGILNGDISRGLKFDLNRAFEPSRVGTEGYGITSPYYTQRQAYFKDLYTLLVALDQGPDDYDVAPTNDPSISRAERHAKLAQWAANVVEFRDADSRIFPFEYDVDPRNGWDVDGDVRTDDGTPERRVVWGCERPEMVIQETLAWRKDATSKGMFVAIHRPWKATALGKDLTTAIPGEPCDYAFDTLINDEDAPSQTGRPSNQIDLAKKAGPHVLVSGTNTMWNNRNSAKYPIWRLRLAPKAPGERRVIRFDADSAAEDATDELVGSAPSPLGTDQTLVIYDTQSIDQEPPRPPVIVTIANERQSVISGLEIPEGWTDVRLYLERFSDPSHEPTKEEWDADPLENPGEAVSPYRYVIVDSVPLVEVATGGENPEITSYRRQTDNSNTALWKAEPLQAVNVPPNAAVFPTETLVPRALQGQWFPWPNRPFVSAAELLLVPQGDSQDLLQEYAVLTPENQPARGVPVPLISVFDAVYVPTRFAGVHATSTAPLPGNHGIFSEITTVNQLSAFREPGRVNINTIPSEAVWNAVVAGPLARPLDANVSAGNRIFTSGTATPAVATSLVEALSLEKNGSTIRPDPPPPQAGESAPVAVPGADKNPAHAIYTATRLANTVTIRSNVFAVWITLRESVANDPDSVKLHRAFYIVDRSIPVAYEPNKSHNVWDCVRLRRIIE